MLATVDVGTNTGRVPGAGQAIKGKKASLLDSMLVLKRIHTLVPILKAMKLEDHLHKLLLAETVQQHMCVGQAIVVPETCIIHKVGVAEWQ